MLKYLLLISVLVAAACSGDDPDEARTHTDQPASDVETAVVAPYEFVVCGERQPDAPAWEGVGVHTHGEGVIHIHPMFSHEQGTGSRLLRWFEYGGGVLDSSHVRLPGLSKTWENGEVCPEDTPFAGEAGTVQVFANGEPADVDAYIPEDGDLVKIVFGPPDDGEWEGDMPTLAPAP